MEGTTNPFYHSPHNPSFSFIPLVKTGHFAIGPYD